MKSWLPPSGPRVRTSEMTTWSTPQPPPVDVDVEVAVAVTVVLEVVEVEVEPDEEVVLAPPSPGAPPSALDDESPPAPPRPVPVVAPSSGVKSPRPATAWHATTPPTSSSTP